MEKSTLQTISGTIISKEKMIGAKFERWVYEIRTARAVIGMSLTIFGNEAEEVLLIKQASINDFNVNDEIIVYYYDNNGYKNIAKIEEFCNTFPPTKVGGFSVTKPVLPDLAK